MFVDGCGEIVWVDYCYVDVWCCYDFVDLVDGFDMFDCDYVDYFVVGVGYVVWY